MRKSILLVDDNHLVAKSLERLLKVEGYDVTTAESGMESREFLK